MENLQKRKVGTAAMGQVWSVENLKAGFMYYFELHGRYPVASEIDKFEYLPSSRSIQRSFGGLVRVRELLGLSGPSQFNKGEARSRVAGEADARARIYEEEFYTFLVSKVSEMRVHEHKVMRPSGTSCDFFVYLTDNSGIIIDLFYAKDIQILSKIVNIKYKKYEDLPFSTYFILIGNDDISQDQIDKIIRNRKTLLPKHIYVMKERTFKDKFDRILN